MSESGCVPHLRRVLRLRDLIFYGIIVITPIAPVPIYGIAQRLSCGHVILSLLLAGIAMMLTAVSYGRMANLYPSAGSAYVYVGRGLNPHLGFLAGWTMILDYLVLPMVAVIQVGLAVERLVPAIPYAVWVTLCMALMTILNLRGVLTTARTYTALLAAMTVVIGAFLILALKYLVGPGASGLVSLKPLYDPTTFDPKAIATATSFAALTYIGFDGLTTLAEEVDNPARNVPLATVAVCAFTALFSCLLVYIAQLVYPDWHVFTNIDTAFMDVTRRVGGEPLFQGMGLVVILSSFGAAMVGIVAASRVLLAMGRDHVLPARVFARLETRTDTPARNILLLSLIAWLGSLLSSLERAGELLNFGALLGFMGVNLTTFCQCYLRRERAYRSLLVDAVAPLIGFLFCFAIWLALPFPAKITGGAWLLLGLTYYTSLKLTKKNNPAPTLPL